MPFSAGSSEGGSGSPCGNGFRAPSAVTQQKKGLMAPTEKQFGVTPSSATLPSCARKRATSKQSTRTHRRDWRAYARAASRRRFARMRRCQLRPDQGRALPQPRPSPTWRPSIGERRSDNPGQRRFLHVSLCRLRHGIPKGPADRRGFPPMRRGWPSLQALLASDHRVAAHSPPESARVVVDLRLLLQMTTAEVAARGDVLSRLG